MNANLTQPPIRTIRILPAPAAAADELETLIRARYPILYVITWEEERLELRLARLAADRNKRLHTWTCTRGLARPGEENLPLKSGSPPTADPLTALDSILADVEPAIYLLKDFHPFTEELRCNLPVIRRLREAAVQLRDSYKTIVLCAPALRLAGDLQKDITVIDLAPPQAAEIAELLDRIAGEIKHLPQLRITADEASRRRLLHAARGLTLREAENVFAKTLVLHGKIDGGCAAVVFSEKQQIVKKSGVLEYVEAPEDMGSVGGMENLKRWLQQRTAAFSEEAAKFGLPAPKGILLLGVQGCGKSLCAKAAAGLWGLPLLRLDVGRVFGGLVGASEENMRRALQTAVAVAPAILWVDEIDKAFAGSLNGAASDGGTAARVLGSFLTWLAEKTEPVFVIATANSVAHLPPELLRKGRLDELFFVDLPAESERAEIFRIQLEKHGRVPDGFDLAVLAGRSAGFSGAEIEQAVIAGLYEAFSAGAELDTQNLNRALAETVPLSKTMSEELDRLRAWRRGRARPAGQIAPPSAGKSGRCMIEL